MSQKVSISRPATVNVEICIRNDKNCQRRVRWTFLCAGQYKEAENVAQTRFYTEKTRLCPEKKNLGKGPLKIATYEIHIFFSLSNTDL